MKKNTQHKPPQKIKESKNKSYKKLFATIIIATIIFLGLAIGSYFGTEIDKVAHKIKESIAIDIEISGLKPIDKVAHKIKESIAIDIEISGSKPIDKEKEEITIEPSVIIPKIINSTNKPKLAIIIDDMTTQRQINSVLSLGYTVNMAFLPPTKGHRKSAKITKNLDKYMVHLPLQASSSKYEEENTLHINDSVSKIEARIKNLKLLYPNTNFLNNHTGSKFTSDQVAMDKLFEILKKYKYTFIDSRTTPNSVAAISAKKYGVKIFSRNIFLDNNKNKEYIQNQLKKAVKSAKKNGIAIAIGHPYRITFETLKNSKYLLKDVELVYVQQL